MTSPDNGSGADHQEGDAADAIRHAEAALAQQNSATAQVDLQVVAAVLNAHSKAAASRDALETLQRDIEQAVATRSDLDTPAGARDFQRYLIGKLRDIQAVVAGASLDDTSNSALMAAWTSLYNSAQPAANAGDPRPAAGAPAPAPAAAPASASVQSRPAATSSEPEPYDDALPDDDFGMARESASPQGASTPAPTAMPSIPSFGGGEGCPAAAGFGCRPDYRCRLHRRSPTSSRRRAGGARRLRGSARFRRGRPGAIRPRAPSAAGPTTVTLPNGETLTAANPQLAAAIEAAAGGHRSRRPFGSRA